MRPLRSCAIFGSPILLPLTATTTGPSFAIDASGPVAEAAPPDSPPTSTRAPDAWVAAWAAAPQGVYPVGCAVGQPGSTDSAGMPRLPALPGDQARDQTLRMIGRPTLDGDVWRLPLSNAFGTEPVRFHRDGRLGRSRHAGASGRQGENSLT